MCPIIVKIKLDQSDESKIGSFRLTFETRCLKYTCFVNILAFFYLKIGNFWPFFVSDLIVITLKPAPIVLPRKSEAVGKGLIS